MRVRHTARSAAVGVLLVAAVAAAGAIAKGILVVGRQADGRIVSDRPCVDARRRSHRGQRPAARHGAEPGRRAARGRDRQQFQSACAASHRRRTRGTLKQTIAIAQQLRRRRLQPGRRPDLRRRRRRATTSSSSRERPTATFAADGTIRSPALRRAGSPSARRQPSYVALNMTHQVGGHRHDDARDRRHAFRSASIPTRR